MNGRDRAHNARILREVGDIRLQEEQRRAAWQRVLDLEQHPHGTPEHAAGALLRAGQSDGYVVEAAPSKNGADVIVRLTPEQALRFCDLIAEDRD